MASTIDNTKHPEFVEGCHELAKNISKFLRSGDCMPSKALSGTSAQPTLVSGPRVERKNENALVSSVSTANQDTKKPVAGS